MSWYVIILFQNSTNTIVKTNIFFRISLFGFGSRHFIGVSSAMLFPFVICH